MQFSNKCRVLCFRSPAQVHHTYLCIALNFVQKVDEKLKQISINVFPTSVLRSLSLEGECTQEFPQYLV